MLPKLKKRLSSFILNEEGKISKSSLVKLSLISTVVSTSLIINSKLALSDGGCGGGGCGSCGACGGGCGTGGGGGGGADPCAPGSVSPGGGCG